MILGVNLWTIEPTSAEGGVAGPVCLIAGQRHPPKRAVKSVAIGFVAAPLREADSGAVRPAPGATRCWTNVQGGEYGLAVDPSSAKSGGGRLALARGGRLTWMTESLTRDGAVRIAMEDAARRSSSDPSISTVDDECFPNSALGAARPGEMNAAVVTPGWRILLNAGDRQFVYRASARQVRHVGDDGTVHLIHPK